MRAVFGQFEGGRRADLEFERFEGAVDFVAVRVAECSQTNGL
jgi:hypothetical protein